MATIYRGEPIIEAPMVATWQIGIGGQTKRTFYGTEAEITSKSLELQIAGYETEVTTGPYWTLVATINIDLVNNPGGEGGVEPEPVPQWELIPHVIQQDIFDTQRPFVLGLPNNVKESIEAKLKNPQNTSIFVVPPKVRSADWINKALRIYVYKRLGVEARQIYTVALKKSIIVSAQYNLQWSVDFVGTVLSNSRITSRYAPPSVITNILPPTYATTETVPVDQITAGGVGIGDAQVVVPFYYGWLEQHPSYQTVANNRIQISQEWVWGKYIVGTNGLYDYYE